MKYIVRTLESVMGRRVVDNYVEANSEEEAIEVFKSGDVEDYDIYDEDVESDVEEILEVKPYNE